MQNNINYVALFLVISMAAVGSLSGIFSLLIISLNSSFYDFFILFLLSYLFNINITLYKNTIRIR